MLNSTSEKEVEAAPEDEDYPDSWRTKKGKHLDEWVPLVLAWLTTPTVKPQEVAEKDWKDFERFATKFFVSKDGRLYRREDGEGHHRLYIEPARRMSILKGAHDANGH